MTLDLAHKVARLRGMALQFERGDLDAEFTAAKAPIAEMRATVVRRLREVADAIEGAE